MGDIVPKDEISEEDYQAIQEAVMETARGRWFLAEYAKRNRVAETNKVLDAIDDVKTYITREHEPADVMQMRLNIVDMTQKIEQIKTEIANTDQSSPDISDAQVALNVVLDETEKATSTILSSAEQIQGIEWEIRERGGLDVECDKIDELVTEIYMACSFQDLTGQRLRKVVQLTEMLDTRLHAMVTLWDASDLDRYREEPKEPEGDDALINGPAMPGSAQGQDMIDSVMGDTQGIEVSKVGAEEIVWSDDPENDDENEPFIIEDEDTVDIKAAAEVEGTAEPASEPEAPPEDVAFAEEAATEDVVAEEAAAEQTPAEPITAEADAPQEPEAPAPEPEAPVEDIVAEPVAEEAATEDVVAEEAAADDVAAFEADASQELSEAGSADDATHQDEADIIASQNSPAEDIQPLEERAAIFN